MTFYKCPGCSKDSVSAHYMRCTSCYRPIIIKELKEAKRNARNAGA